MHPTFFTSQAELRGWLEQNHNIARELWIGFHKKASGRPTITNQQALDEALCFGWIDGIRKSIDNDSYTNRFTPRKAKSIWSKVNIKRAEELSRLGLMQAPGLKAFEARDQGLTNQRESGGLGEVQEQQFRANEKAWEFFVSQPPSYRKPATWWVVSAKKEETRQRRLNLLIEDSEKGLRLSMLSPGRRRRPASR
jgi:uncharacterized protein YdeI (YjbR/CyaY-like superfamily)